MGVLSMNSLYASIVNETEKLLLRKKTVFFLILSAIFPLAAMALIKLFQSKMGFLAVTSTNYPILLLGLFTGFILPLFAFTAAADLFAGELGDKTLKIALTRPITRFKVFLSKSISIGLFIIIILGIVFITSAISGLFLDSNTHLTGLWQGVLAYIVAAMPMLALGAVAIFLAQFFQSSSGALTTCIFVYIAGKAVPFVAPKLAKVILFSYTNWHMLWLGNSVGAVKLLNIFLLILSYIIIFFSAGYYFFDKRDL
jgi:ABC-2 type transport system permease protein